MEFSESTITAAIRQFYTTTDENLRRQLNEWLMKAQNSEDVWRFAWILLDASRNNSSNDLLAVQHFAANCLHQKLSSGRIDEYLLQCVNNGSDAETADRFLRDSLIENCTRVESKLVKHKLALALASYVVYCTPDIWPEALENLTEFWKSTQPILLLDILGSIPNECSTMTTTIDRKSLVRGTLRNREAFVAETASYLLQLHRADGEIVDAAVKCVESWVDFCKDPGEWVGIVALCLQCAVEVGGATMSAVSKFFCRFVENSDLRKLDNFLGQLFDFFAPLIIRQRNNTDEEEFEDIVDMVVALLENHSHFIFKRLTGAESIRILVDAALNLTNSAGFYPVDETRSGKTFNFWHNLYEDALAEEDSSARSIWLTSIEPVYSRLGDILLTKLKYPQQSIYANWSADDKESFERYRTEGGDVLACCYRVLPTNRFLDTIVGEKFASAAAAVASWEDLEIILYALQSIGDYVPSDHAGLRNFLENLSRIPFADSILVNTSLKMISVYAHVIGDEKRMLKPNLEGVVLRFLNESETVYNATVALENLTRNGDQILIDDENLCSTIVTAAFNCFHDGRFQRADQLRALSSIGFVLSTQSNETVLRNLNEFLAPRLQRLQNVVDGKTTPCTKEELLMEFDVMTCLISALGSGLNRRCPTKNEETATTNPVYLIIGQSFGLFENLYAASNGDADVASKIVDTLKRALTTLTDEVRNLLPQFCRVVALLFPPHAVAIDLTKPLFLLFANEQQSTPTMASMFEHISDKVLVGENRKENDEAIESFLGLCQQLAKKQWTFFTRDDTASGCDRSVQIACRALGNPSSDSPTVRQASQFLCELFSHADSPRVTTMIDKYGSALMAACFDRLRVELLTSCVEYVADVVLNLLKFNRQNIQQQNLALTNPLLAAMLKEVGDKRKFREYAKQYNIACRKEIRNA